MVFWIVLVFDWLLAVMCLWLLYFIAVLFGICYRFVCVRFEIGLDLFCGLLLQYFGVFAYSFTCLTLWECYFMLFIVEFLVLCAYDSGVCFEAFWYGVVLLLCDFVSFLGYLC